jgi:small subunit ribosomal protein S20
MPNIRSAKKRMRQDRVRRDRNRSRRSAMRTALRRLDLAIASGDKDAVAASWRGAQSVLDRSARVGAIQRNTASRKKARVARRVQAFLASAD